MPPWDGIISGAGSVLSGVLGYFGQQSANKAMLKATRETNEQNYKIWQEQQQHNIDMFNLENEANRENWQYQFDTTNAYNDPSAQVARLRAAGLNPSMAMQGGNAAGVASSSSMGSASANPAGAPQMQAPPPEAFSSPEVAGLREGMQGLITLSQAISSMHENKLTDTKVDETLSNIGLLDSLKDTHDWNRWFSKHTSGAQSSILESQADLLRNEVIKSNSTWATDVLLKHKMLDNQVAQNVLLGASITEKNIMNSFLTQQQAEQVALLIATTSEKYANIKEIDARIKKINQEVMLLMTQQGYFNSLTKLNDQMYQFNDQANIFRLEGINLDNDIKNNEISLGNLKVAFENKVLKPMISRTITEQTFWKNHYDIGNAWLDNPFGAFGYGLKHFTPKLNFPSMSIGVGPISVSRGSVSWFGE